MRIALFASGRLGFDVLQKIYKEYGILVVFTDKGSENIISFCATNNVPCYIGNPRRNKACHIVSKIEIDVLLSVNYLFLIEKDLIDWPESYAVNFHGSLLPKYRGRTPHVWAIINNEKVTGITAHLIDEGCDTGPILDQIEVAIDDEDTGAVILDKYSELYPEFVKHIIEKIIKGDITPRLQDHQKATYYSKRSSEDGRINWEWQKERILNWVRAQAHPYPGAFTFYNETKIIINKVVVNDTGYTDSVINGVVLKVEDGRPVVKTQNGALKIVDYRTEKQISFQQGEMFL